MNLSLILCFITYLIQITIILSWKSFQWPKLNKQFTAAIICSSTLAFNPIDNVVLARIDAFDGAAKAMLSSKEKSQGEVSFDQLSDAGKKRKALALCKDGSKSKAAGYKSSAACTESVLNGNYAVAFPSDSFVNSKILQKASSSEDSRIRSVKPTSKSTVKNDAVVVLEQPMKQKLVKTQDLSDLSLASKKRRALAGCKKSEVRKYAKLVSESKCSSTVLSGDYDAVVEALEYGL